MTLPVKYDTLPPRKKKLVREKYIKIQKGLCKHCGQPLDSKPCKSVTDWPIDKSLFPKGFFNSPVHLHHDHNTGMTIGAIHNYCNAYLWQYEGE